jgi:hypothetical protein
LTGARAQPFLDIADFRNAAGPSATEAEPGSLLLLLPIAAPAPRRMRRCRRPGA